VEVILERLAAIGGAAPVDHEDDPAAIDQILVARLTPVARHALDAGTAIDLDEHGVAPARLQPRRQHLIMKRSAVLGRDGAELRRRVAGEMGRVGMVDVERILLDPGDAAAVGAGEIDLAGCVGLDRKTSARLAPRPSPPNSKSRLQSRGRAPRSET
jgi:hypothetical protein